MALPKASSEVLESFIGDSGKREEDFELPALTGLETSLGGIVEQIVKINDYISVPDCATTGTVKDIKGGGGDAISPNSMLIYEIETPQGMMRVPGDWLARLIKPA